MHLSLLAIVTEYQYLRGRLKAEFPEIDDQTLSDTVEGLSTLPEALAAVVRSYLDDLSLAAALGLRIGDMQERLARIEHRAEKKRALITNVMERAEIKKLAEADFSASLRSVPPSLAIIDEGAIPEAYWKPQPPKLDRQGLTAALRAGAEVAGAALGNGHVTLSVRTK
jgi:hypothetical protein